MSYIIKSLAKGVEHELSDSTCLEFKDFFKLDIILHELLIPQSFIKFDFRNC